MFSNEKAIILNYWYVLVIIATKINKSQTQLASTTKQ